MNQFFESAVLALQAIWANKLRSLLTVLGNIVAVTSIIAVVSLVQGLNASVKDAFTSTAGADAFSVQQRGVALTNDDAERQQSNPRVSLAEADAIRQFGGRIRLVMAEADAGGPAKYLSAVHRLDFGPRRDQGIQQPGDHQPRTRAAHHGE